MARKQDPQPLIRGTCTHRRTERDYPSVLLDTVTLDDWRDVVTATPGTGQERRPGGPRLAGAIPGREAGDPGAKPADCRRATTQRRRSSG